MGGCVKGGGGGGWRMEQRGMEDGTEMMEDGTERNERNGRWNRKE